MFQADLLVVQAGLLLCKLAEGLSRFEPFVSGLVTGTGSLMQFCF